MGNNEGTEKVKVINKVITKNKVINERRVSVEIKALVNKKRLNQACEIVTQNFVGFNSDIWK